LGGLDALPQIRDAAPGCEVVVLTASGTEENLLSAIRGGAAGYLLKSEPPERIVQFLRGVGNGEAALSGEVARRLLKQVREGGARGVPDRIAHSLSAREVEVLLLLDDHLGTDEIAARLYISEHTVRSHVKSLLRKLGVSSRREALEALNSAREVAEAVRGHSHPGERIVDVRVEAGRDEHEVRLEGLHCRRDQLVEGAQVLLVARSGRKRHVQRRLVAFARAAAARVERPLV